MVDNPHAPADIAFLGKNPGEHCQFYFRQHWIRLLRPLIRVTVWSAFVCLALWFFVGISTPKNVTTRHIALVFLAATWATAHLLFLTAIYRHFLYIIVVTNQRIHRIKRTLITHDDHQTIDLLMLQDVYKSQHGPIQNILGFGTLTLEAQETVLKIHFTPRIAEKYEQILHIKELERSRTMHTA
ncbi:MAG: hypothetical protein Greene041662_331 [Candidatus Peregrinibacteria bacterium Greene0416_62]|nr:MAG: hypothetical protein Greene041662_331 [Candidatus Peregrinibacteria bacterium Greene0416_62]